MKRTLGCKDQQSCIRSSHLQVQCFKNTKISSHWADLGQSTTPEPNSEANRFEHILFKQGLHATARKGRTSPDSDTKNANQGDFLKKKHNFPDTR